MSSSMRKRAALGGGLVAATLLVAPVAPVFAAPSDEPVAGIAARSVQLSAMSPFDSDYRRTWLTTGTVFVRKLVVDNPGEAPKPAPGWVINTNVAAGEHNALLRWNDYLHGGSMGELDHGTQQTTGALIEGKSTKLLPMLGDNPTLPGLAEDWFASDADAGVKAVDGSGVAMWSLDFFAAVRQSVMMEDLVGGWPEGTEWLNNLYSLTPYHAPDGRTFYTMAELEISEQQKDGYRVVPEASSCSVYSKLKPGEPDLSYTDVLTRTVKLDAQSGTFKDLQVAVTDTVFCTFVNEKAPGALKIVKAFDDSVPDLSGIHPVAVFSGDYVCKLDGDRVAWGTWRVAGKGEATMTPGVGSPAADEIVAGAQCSATETSPSVAASTGLPSGYSWGSPMVSAAVTMVGGKAGTITVTNSASSVPPMPPAVSPKPSVRPTPSAVSPKPSVRQKSPVPPKPSVRQKSPVPPKPRALPRTGEDSVCMGIGCAASLLASDGRAV